MFLFFPVSPTVALVGSTDYKSTFGQHGLLHSDVPDEAWVDQLNAQVCRFGYEAVIAHSRSQGALIEEFAAVSPVHEAMSVPMAKGLVTIHRQVFGKRVPKPKWRDD